MFWIPVLAGVAVVGLVLRARAVSQQKVTVSPGTQKLTDLGYNVPVPAQTPPLVSDALAMGNITSAVNKVAAEQLIRDQATARAQIDAKNARIYVPYPSDTIDGIMKRFGTTQRQMDAWNPNRPVTNYNNTGVTVSVCDIVPGQNVYMPMQNVVFRGAIEGAMNPSASDVKIEEIIKSQDIARTFPVPASRTYTPVAGDSPTEINRRLSICPEKGQQPIPCPSERTLAISNLNPEQTTPVDNYLGSGKTLYAWSMKLGVPVKIPDYAVDKGPRKGAMGQVSNPDAYTENYSGPPGS